MPSVARGMDGAKRYPSSCSPRPRARNGAGVGHWRMLEPEPAVNDRSCFRACWNRIRSPLMPTLPAGETRKKPNKYRLFVVPVERIELPTFGLQSANVSGMSGTFSESIFKQHHRSGRQVGTELAMTEEYESAISPRNAPELLPKRRPSRSKRAQGRPGARRTHGPLCNKKAQGQEPQV
jgi:hypothetical protein